MTATDGLGPQFGPLSRASMARAQHRLDTGRTVQTPHAIGFDRAAAAGRRNDTDAQAAAQRGKPGGPRRGPAPLPPPRYRPRGLFTPEDAGKLATQNGYSVEQASRLTGYSTSVTRATARLQSGTTVTPRQDAGRAARATQGSGWDEAEARRAAYLERQRQAKAAKVKRKK